MVTKYPPVLVSQILKKKYMVLGYTNKQPAAMAAILSKIFSSAGIWEDFAPGC